jgi:hypothetical protein
MIISFAHTTPALLAGAKTVTRRTWTPKHAAQIKAGMLVDAWDHSPRVRGSHKVATIRIVRDPWIQNSRELLEDDYHREGFAWLDANLHESRWLTNLARIAWRQSFELWRDLEEDCYVVEFELLEVLA